jgi:hypothetical protein
LFNEPDIVKYIKTNRLGWAGHVIQMDNNRTVKKVFNTKPIGIRINGRPKLRWEDDVIQDNQKTPITVQNYFIFQSYKLLMNNLC